MGVLGSKHQELSPLSKKQKVSALHYGPVLRASLEEARTFLSFLVVRAFLAEMDAGSSTAVMPRRAAIRQSLVFILLLIMIVL